MNTIISFETHITCSKDVSLNLSQAKFPSVYPRQFCSPRRGKSSRDVQDTYDQIRILIGFWGCGTCAFEVG